MLVNQDTWSIIFDIDGTLSDCSHRLHHLKSDPPNWIKFNDGMVLDTFNKHIVEIYDRFCGHDLPIRLNSIMITGRPETHRRQTETWLKNYEIKPDYLFMRPEGDYRSDVDIKKEIVGKHIVKAKVLFVLEDRSKVVKMWRELGYNCLQCAEGDF